MQARRGLSMARMAALVFVLFLVSACSVGELTGSGKDPGRTSIRLLVPVSADAETLVHKALIKGFQAENSNFSISLETQPGGTEGDNLTKTKLSTGEMPEVFLYNSGSLLQSLNPDTQLTDLSGESWVKDLTTAYRPTVSTPKGHYGAPVVTGQAGGVLYNKRVYADLGLKVPTNWAEFRENNRKIKQAGKTAIIQSFGTDWTAQIFVLADFGNVISQDPKWAEEYTKNQRKYAQQPALQGWLNQEQTAADGFYNKNAPAAQFEAAIKLLATGEGVHYPILSGALTTLRQNHPQSVSDIGMFPLPAQAAADTRLTVWLPNSYYIPKTATGVQLELAKKYISFVLSPAGCKIINETFAPTGSYATSTCALPSNVSPALQDIQRWEAQNKTVPAAEFLSPVKGPALPNLTTEVGRGIRSAADGAKLYDADVTKQAKQLGLPGW